MARPTKYDRDTILDAALDLFAEEGAEAIRIQRIAQRLGAPSGSIYHRFPSRIALASALWNRTVARFQATLSDALDEVASEPRVVRRAVLEAARRSLRWCADHPGEAALLDAGPAAVGRGDWPEAEAATRRERQDWVAGRVTLVAERLGLPAERVLYALVDLTTATARRRLMGPPFDWEGLALEAIAELLGPRSPVAIVQLTPDEGERFRRIRLRSLLEAPEAFCSDFDEVASRPPSAWREQLESMPTFVAVRAGRDVGVVRSCPEEEPNRRGLLSMWVAPEARGCGVASDLVGAVVDQARSQGARELVLEVWSANGAAVALYAREGFALIEEDKGLQTRLRQL